MKRIRFVVGLAGVALMAACATPTAQPPAEQVGNESVLLATGGQLCVERAPVGSRIPRVECTSAAPKPATGVAGVRCTGQKDVCGKVGEMIKPK